MSLRLASRRQYTAQIANSICASSRRPASQFRSFFNLPANDTQTISATRTLPYSQRSLYRLISDIDSYSTYVPYCSHSRVTKWSQPDEHGLRRPVLADLHVGWGGFDEVFTSRLHCVPDVSVEAVSGDPADMDARAASSVFKSLFTLWHLKPVSHDASPSTEVHLVIKYQFTNPLYAAVSAAVSDKVAGLMIEAFEKRAQEKLSSSQSLVSNGRASAASR